MQQHKNVEDKLRELEEQQDPVFGDVEKHWGNMKAMLPPEMPPVQTNTTAGGWLGVAGLSLLAASAIYYFIGTGNKWQPPIEKLPAAAFVPAPLFTDTFIKPDSTGRIKYHAGSIKRIHAIQQFFSQGIVNKRSSHIGAGSSVLSGSITISLPLDAAGITAAARTRLLKDFLGSLQKEKETFEIESGRDTFIRAREGTVVFIPANSFNCNGKIKLSLGEYYQYADMVANQLQTVSDGQQLVSGGMFNIRGMDEKNTMVKIRPGNSIKLFVPGITQKDSMSVFLGNKGDETIRNEERGLPANWQLTSLSIDSPVSKMFIRAIDLRDNNLYQPFVSYANANKAIFIRSRESVYSRKELKALLEKKYGDVYSKIRIKNQWERNLLGKKVSDGIDEEWSDRVFNSHGVGDTAALTPLSIRIYKLQPIDTVYKIVSWIHKGTTRLTPMPQLTPKLTAAIGEKYNIQLNQLGWINCDRFYKTRGTRNDYVVDLKDSSYSYYTVLVFDRMKSIMPGNQQAGTTVVFPGIPAKEPFTIISIGINSKGQAVYAMKKGPFNSSFISNLPFEPATATSVKTSLSKLDRVL